MGRTSAIVLGAVALAFVAVPAAAQTDDDLCARFEAVEIGGTVTEPSLVELSGLAASLVHPGVLWAHNDSGGAPELYAMRDDGIGLGAYPVEGATATDWEDIASGPGPDGTGGFLYVGDIGDNGALRPSVTVFRVPEPEAAPVAPGESLPGAEAIQLKYPTGPVDAEALLVDPISGDLLIVTKGIFSPSRVLRADAASLLPGAPVTLVDEGGLRVPLPPDPGSGLPGTAVTGGDISPDGSIVLLRTYRSVLAFSRAEGQSVAEALLSEPCFAPQAEEPQGEAVAFTGDGTDYVTMSEGTGVPVHRVELTTPAVPTTTTSTSATVGPSLAGDIELRSSDRRPAIVAAIVVAVVLVAVNVAARRRRRSVG